MPASITSKPPADMPADSAAARKSPETRVSRPTSARRRPSNSPLLPLISQHTHCSIAQIERQLCGQVPVCQSSNAVGSEHTWHESQVLAISSYIAVHHRTQRVHHSTKIVNSMLRYLHTAVCDVRQTAVCNVVRFPQSPSFLRSHFHPPIPTGWVIMGPKDPLSITVMGLCLGWLV